MSNLESKLATLPNLTEGDFQIENFQFTSGECLPQLRIHYSTVGYPKRDSIGNISNAVLLIHNTSGGSTSWLLPSLANELFTDAQPLDASKYFLIIPDSIGFGQSSKPSDGLRSRFPHYRYADAVHAQYRLITAHFGITHLRLIVGISMGGMHAWMWAGMYSDFMDAIVPIASQPTPLSGRNWIQRRILIEAIRRDPDWNNGDYKKNPSQYVYTAPITAIMTESVVRLQAMAPTRNSADALYENFVEQAKKRDANDLLYAMESGMDYDPSDLLTSIKAHVLAINFADDAVNPPELEVVDRAIRIMPKAKYRLIRGSNTRGHYTCLDGVVWKPELAELMGRLDP